MPHATPTPDDRENTYQLLMDVFRAWRATVPGDHYLPSRFAAVAALAAADVLDDET